MSLNQNGQCNKTKNQNGQFLSMNHLFSQKINESFIVNILINLHVFLYLYSFL